MVRLTAPREGIIIKYAQKGDLSFETCTLLCDSAEMCSVLVLAVRYTLKGEVNCLILVFCHLLQTVIG